MGLLDEAIREHLELKRRRGADPAEIERLEHEALGPVRRVRENGEPLLEGLGPTPYEEPVPDAGLSPEVPSADASRLEQEEALLPGESWSSESTLPEFQPPVAPPVAAPPPAMSPPAPEPEAGGQTAEYDVESAHEHDPYPPSADEDVLDGELVPDHLDTSRAEAPSQGGPEQGDEDVLEETPEFLQDTPDHDRLWFEQRPPRDFDFYG